MMNQNRGKYLSSCAQHKRKKNCEELPIILNRRSSDDELRGD